MSNKRLGTVLRHIHSMVDAQSLAGATDGQLLARFASQRQEAAFAALLRRHGPMVLGVCRRVLRRDHDAEDVFQATFLLLARKAGSIRKRESVSSWLHGVAYRLAVKARVQGARRRAHERQAATMRTTRPRAQAAWQELQAMLDEATEELPEKYRTALVLCYLEGKTHKEAAHQLGCPLVTFRTWLARGRKLLRDRLVRRGLALSAGALASALATSTADAGVPASLLNPTLRAALKFAAGEAAARVAAPPVAVLVEGGLKAMLGNKLRIATVLLFAAALAAGGTGLVTHQVLAGRQDAARQAGAPKSTTPRAARPKPENDPQARTDRHGDPLPDGALLRIGTVRYRAGAGVNNAVLSPDGKLLATACESGITLFELATGKPRHLRGTGLNVFYGHQPLLAFSPNGKELINVTGGGNLRLWSVATGKRLHQIGNQPELVPVHGGMLPAPPVPGPDDPHWSAVWSPSDGKSLVVSTRGNVVLFLEPSSGKPLQRFRVAGELTSVAPDGKRLAVINARRGEVVLYNEAGKELRRFLRAGKAYLATLCCAGKLLITVNEESEVRVWDAATGRARRVIHGPLSQEKHFLTVVSATPDGKTLLAGTLEGEILRWDLGSGKALKPLRGHRRLVTGLLLSREGRTLVSVSWDHVIRRWDLATGEAEAAGDGYAGHITVTRSPDGRTIAAADYSGRLEIWDAASGKRIRMLRPCGPYVSKLRFSPDGKRLALAQSDCSIGLWDPNKGRELRSLKQAATPTDPYGSWFEALSLSPDGRFLVASARTAGMRMWEVPTGRVAWHDPNNGRAAFSPDGKTLVTGGQDRQLHFRDAATGKVRFSLTAGMEAGMDNEFVYSIAFSPVGGVLATGHLGGTIYLRDPKTGRERKALKGHQQVPCTLSFSPDGCWLASSGDHTVRIWEVATGAQVLRLNGHEGRTTQAEFGPDGRTVLSSSDDLTALLWSLRPAPRAGGKRPLQTLWTDLAGDPAKAYRALWTLTDDPKASSAFLRHKISPARTEVDEKRVRKLLADLDSPRFRARETASRALAELDVAAEGALRRALRETKSAEVRQRLRELLNRLQREPTAEDLRRARAVGVMEWCGTAEARQVLRDWARGTADAPLTRDARAALERLERTMATRPE
ncbi:MAG TPA: sigma-70 family RNA polymerase sigma factor [Gemmataceae bacterium]|nr:sigma-70 family RNA polymerase sigma factor [Gemmataceae bacterium]